MDNVMTGRVLVTGGTGFVGGHLVEKLLSKGLDVVVPYRSLNPLSYFLTQNLQNKATLVSCDITDRDRVFDLICRYDIRYVYHLAAQTIVPTAVINPHETIQTNIMGTTNVLEAARLNPTVKGIIFASSDKAYGKTSSFYTESTPLKGDHPYDVSKSSADLICQAYYQTYKTPVIVTRFGNIYGEGDMNFSRIIPGILESAITKRELTIRSNGTYVREYLYVGDVVDAYVSLLMHFQTFVGQSFNFGTDYALSVMDVIHESEKSLQLPIKYQIANTSRNEIPYQRLSWEKANKELHWAPQYTLPDVIHAIYRWYEMYFQRRDKSSISHEITSTRDSEKNNNGTIYFGS